MVSVFHRHFAMPLCASILCAAVLTSRPHVPGSLTALLTFAVIASVMIVMFWSLGTARPMVAVLPVARRPRSPQTGKSDRGD
jgi:hypothetical protein